MVALTSPPFPNHIGNGRSWLEEEEKEEEEEEEEKEEKEEVQFIKVSWQGNQAMHPRNSGRLFWWSSQENTQTLGKQKKIFCVLVDAVEPSVNTISMFTIY